SVIGGMNPSTTRSAPAGTGKPVNGRDPISTGAPRKEPGMSYSDVPRGGDIEPDIHVTGSQPSTTATGAACPFLQWRSTRIRPCFMGLIQRLIRFRLCTIPRYTPTLIQP